MIDSTWHELAIETAMVVHVEQIVGGAAVECHCGAEAVLFITSEPDMEPGPVCASCGHKWIGITVELLRRRRHRDRAARSLPGEPSGGNRWADVSCCTSTRAIGTPATTSAMPTTSPDGCTSTRPAARRPAR